MSFEKFKAANCITENLTKLNRCIIESLAISTVVVGFIAMCGLPLAQFPEIVPPKIIASTTYTGANAITIEQPVAAPLKQQMNRLDNVFYLQSTNANDDTMQLTVRFGIETDVKADNAALTLVNCAVGRRRNREVKMKAIGAGIASQPKTLKRISAILALAFALIPVQLAWAIQGPPGLRAGVFSIFENLHAIDEYVLYSG